MAVLWGNIKLGCFIWWNVVHCKQLWRSIELLGNEQQRPALIYSVMSFWLLWLISLNRAGKVDPSLLKLTPQPRLEGKRRNMGALLQKSSNINEIIISGKSLVMFYANMNSLWCIPWAHYLCLSMSMLESSTNAKKRQEKTQLNSSTWRPSNEVLVMCRYWSGWNQAHYTTLHCKSKSSHSQTSKRHSVVPQLSQLWPFNMLQLRFIPLHLLLSQKMLTNLSNHFCNMLTALLHATPSATFAVQCEYLFSQTGFLSIHLLLRNHCHAPGDGCQTGFNAVQDCAFTSWEMLEVFGVCGQAAVETAWLTSPRGPGSLIRPVPQWCTVCRHIPDCCVGSGLRSSGTPDSSCPAGTCSTTHPPPSHQILYHLKV